MINATNRLGVIASYQGGSYQPRRVRQRGLASCTLSKRVHHHRVKVTARATDLAGNVSKWSVTYTVRAG